MGNTCSRVAHTGRGTLTLQPSDRRLAFMRKHRYWSAVVVDRVLLIAPSISGGMGCEIEPDRNAGYSYSYSFTDIANTETLVRFRVQVSELVDDPNMETFQFTIPPNHLLPWPRLRLGMRCVDVAETEFRKRLRSCMIAKDDPRDVTNNVPQVVKDLIGSAGTWMKIVNEELELA